VRVKTKISVPGLALILLSVLAGACGQLDIEDNRTVEKTDAGQSGPSVTLEIFPAFISNNRIHILIPEEQDSWQFAMTAAPHANQQAKEKLSARGLEAKIVHSTSWRQDRSQLVITYLAVINQPEQVPDGFRNLTFENSGMVRGGATTPPPEIPAGAVISHALRHLAWLYQTDPAVRDELSQSWAEALRDYQPQPAGSVVF